MVNKFNFMKKGVTVYAKNVGGVSTFVVYLSNIRKGGIKHGSFICSHQHRIYGDSTKTQSLKTFKEIYTKNLLSDEIIMKYTKLLLAF